jgi:transposase
VGIEASGQSQWFERMLAELGHEVWIGDPAKIRASCERKQNIDRRDAELLLKLLAEDRFPRIWVPTAAEGDGRQLPLHRHKLVRIRTQVKNQLQALAVNQGVQRNRKLSWGGPSRVRPFVLYSLRHTFLTRLGPTLGHWRELPDIPPVPTGTSIRAKTGYWK